MTHTLYRFYGRSGVLLYIGMTLDTPQRFRSHRESKDWWDQVRDIRLEHYPDRESVLVAEREAIKREQPFYNLAHNAVPPPGPNAIKWKCDVCGKTVREGKGYIHVDEMAAWEAYRFSLARDNAIRNASPPQDWSVGVSEIPGLVAWEVHHLECDPEPDRSDYWIDVERWSTSDQALDWAAHLSEKNWVAFTDLGALLRSSRTQSRRQKHKAKSPSVLSEVAEHELAR